MKTKNLVASLSFFLFMLFAGVVSSQSPDSLDRNPIILGYELGAQLPDEKDLKEKFKYKNQVTYNYIGEEKTWQGYKIESLEIQTHKGSIVSVTLYFKADTMIVKTLEQLYGKGTGSETAKEWNGKKIGVSYLQAMNMKPVDGKMKMIPSDISVSYYDISLINEGF